MEERALFTKVDYQLLNYATYYLRFIYPVFDKGKTEDPGMFVQIVEKMGYKVSEAKQTTNLKSLAHFFNLALKEMGECVEQEFLNNRPKRNRDKHKRIAQCTEFMKNDYFDAIHIVPLYDMGLLDDNSSLVARLCL